VHAAPSEFARLLGEIKRDAGLSDQAVADAAGIDRSQAWRWANTAARPGYEPVRRLAAWLLAERPHVATAALSLLPAAGFETPPGMAPPAPPAMAPVTGIRAYLYAALSTVNAPLRERVLAEAASGRPFADPVERAIWESPGWDAMEKAEEIASYRARRAELGGQSAEETG
jgi:transcriptional regulator with XRE-family HTH domain